MTESYGLLLKSKLYANIINKGTGLRYRVKFEVKLSHSCFHFLIFHAGFDASNTNSLQLKMFASCEILSRGFFEIMIRSRSILFATPSKLNVLSTVVFFCC